MVSYGKSNRCHHLWPPGETYTTLKPSYTFCCMNIMLQKCAQSYATYRLWLLYIAVMKVGQQLCTTIRKLLTNTWTWLDFRSRCQLLSSGQPGSHPRPAEGLILVWTEARSSSEPLVQPVLCGRRWQAANSP
jgi:hypothetical protein